MFAGMRRPPNHLIILGIGGLIVTSHLLWTSYQWHLHARLRDRLQEHPRDTRVESGIPGFYILNNVWFRNDTFHVFNADPDSFPLESQLFSGRTRLEHHSVLEPRPVPDTWLDGTNLFLNEGAAQGWNGFEGWDGLWHYYHFAAEDVLGGLAALSSTLGPGQLCELPERLLIPWGGYMGYLDKWGMNKMVIDGVFAGNLINDVSWARMVGKGNQWIYFERVVVVDRWASHLHNPQAGLWNKMALPVFEHLESLHASRECFSAARMKLLTSLDIAPSEPRTKIVYIDRQSTSRRLPNETYDELLKMFEGIRAEGVTVDVLLLEGMDKHQQVQAVADASILIGIHGNGLTHELWMPQDSVLIEMFPPHAFLRDYQAVAEVIGHRYIAIRNDTVLEREEWQHLAGEDALAMRDGTPVLLEVPLLREVLFGLL